MPNLSGGNFDEKLEINGGHIAPRGPLMANGNLVSEVYIWVVQMRDDESGGAFKAELEKADLDARFENGADPDKWDTAGFLAVGGRMAEAHTGAFLPGPATGFGVVVATSQNDDPPKTKVSTWTDTILLIPGT